MQVVRSKAATHYCLECTADAGPLAAITLALQQVNQGLAQKDEGFVDARLLRRAKGKGTASRMKEVLAGRGMKLKGAG